MKPFLARLPGLFAVFFWVLILDSAPPHSVWASVAFSAAGVVFCGFGLSLGAASEILAGWKMPATITSIAGVSLGLTFIAWTWAQYFANNTIFTQAAMKYIYLSDGLGSAMKIEACVLALMVAAWCFKCNTEIPAIPRSGFALASMLVAMFVFQDLGPLLFAAWILGAGMVAGALAEEVLGNQPQPALGAVPQSNLC
jgi:hypothetical protein